MPECILRKHWQLLLLLSYPAAFTRGHLCVDIVFDTVTYLPVIRANWNFNEIKPARAKVEACTRSVKVNSFVSFYRKKLRGSRKLFPLVCFYIDMIWERESWLQGPLQCWCGIDAWGSAAVAMNVALWALKWNRSIRQRSSLSQSVNQKQNHTYKTALEEV